MFLRQLEDKGLSQFSYLVGCQKTGEAIVVDPLRDIERYYALAEKEGLKITKAIDTHIHADYLTGLREFANRGVKVYASKEGGKDWQYEWLLNSDYDYELLADKSIVKIGNISIEAIHTPGHTPEHLTYLLRDHPRSDKPLAAFTGDFIFVGDVGRPDLLESAAKVEGAMKVGAKELFASIKKFKSFSKDLAIFPGHGSGSACGKALGAVPMSTLGYELDSNPALVIDDEDEFVEFILKDQPAPPLYFARMKKENKLGPALLEERPVGLLKDPVGKVINLKSEKEGSGIIASENTLTEIAGSYLEPDEEITLVVDKDNFEKAKMDLILIGLDNVKGFVNEYNESQSGSDDKELFFLDVRGEKEYREENLGTLLIPHTRIADRLSELDKSKKIMVFCAAGGRAVSAASFLQSKGFDAKSIGGIDDARNLMS